MREGGFQCVVIDHCLFGASLNRLSTLFLPAGLEWLMRGDGDDLRLVRDGIYLMTRIIFP